MFQSNPVQNLGCIASKTKELQWEGGKHPPWVGSRPKSPGSIRLRSIAPLPSYILQKCVIEIDVMTNLGYWKATDDNIPHPSTGHIKHLQGKERQAVNQLMAV